MWCTHYVISRIPDFEIQYGAWTEHVQLGSNPRKNSFRMPNFMLSSGLFSVSICLLWPLGVFDSPLVQWMLRVLGRVGSCTCAGRSLPGFHGFISPVRCTSGRSITATLVVASKTSLRLLWWPPTEYTLAINWQMLCRYPCMMSIAFCWE